MVVGGFVGWVVGGGGGGVVGLGCFGDVIVVCGW